MVQPIRSKQANQPGCPVDDHICQHDAMHFDITVEKLNNAEAKPVYVLTWGLGCRELHINRIYDEKCDPLFAPMFCGGQAMCLSETFPDTILTVPGKYRFVATDGEPLNWDDDFGYEATPIHKEYAELWFQQQQLHCCRDNIK